MDEIYSKIPHREPFLFVDKIISRSENGIVVERTIRAEEVQFEGHYPGNPIMPGVLLCEATFQAAAIYLVEKMEQSGSASKGLTPVLSRISDARFKQMVKPGDVIQIQIDFKETLGKFHFLKGKITNQTGKVVMTNEFALALIEEQ